MSATLWSKKVLGGAFAFYMPMALLLLFVSVFLLLSPSAALATGEEDFNKLSQELEPLLKRVKAAQLKPALADKALREFYDYIKKQLNNIAQTTDPALQAK